VVDPPRFARIAFVVAAFLLAGMADTSGAGARNVILFIGDGMGAEHVPTHVSASSPPRLQVPPSEPLAREVQSVAQDAMATKVKLMKLLQEMRGFSEIHRFTPPARPAALFLMQLRSHVAETSNGKRRLVVRIDVKDAAPVADDVKIRHVLPGVRG
jgi:hypothetical protein